jgi:hypothetical protein
MPASASMPPTPHATTPMPLIMVVWLSVPDERVGVVDAVLVEHAAAEVLEVHLVHDAEARAARP